MTELSPAAQNVILEYSKIAYDSEIELLFSPLPWEHRAVAAALRAAADHLCLRWHAEISHPADVLNNIANELEGA